jgi:hypothetical protein
MFRTAGGGITGTAPAESAAPIGQGRELGKNALLQCGMKRCNILDDTLTRATLLGQG